MSFKNLLSRTSNAIKRAAKGIVNALWSAVKKTCKFVYWLVKEVVKAVLNVSLIVILALMIPEVHKNLIGYKTSQHVYMITKTAEGGGGGTGFAIRAPSGENYILTNSHICAMAKDTNGVLMVRQAGMSRAVPKKIIEDSGYTDLCLIEGFRGRGGLDLASSVSMREGIAFIGHPLLNPLVTRRGEIIGAGDVKLIVGSPDEKSCNLPKQSIQEVRGWFGEEEVCVETIRSYITDVETYGGNSGSPAVNKWGNVIGVVFASDTRSNWGFIIPLEDIQEFVAPY